MTSGSISRCLTSTVATEGSIEQVVHDLVEQERIDLIASGEQIVSDSHQVLDYGCDFVQSEADRAAMIRHSSGARPKMLDVFGTKRADATGKLDRFQLPLADEVDEVFRTESGGSDRIRRREQAVWNDL